MRSQLFVVSALVLTSGIGAWAQAPPKIAVIDMQSALLGTRDGQKAAAELKSKFTPKEQEFQKRQQELAQKQDAYRKGENTMAEDAKAKLAREVTALQTSLQRDTDDARQDLDQEQNRILQDLGGKMMQVLNKYAADNQYTLVLDVSGQPNPVLFASSGADITREIIALYDKAAPTTPTGPAPTATPKTGGSPGSLPRTTSPAPNSSPAVKRPATPPAGPQ